MYTVRLDGAFTVMGRSMLIKYLYACFFGGTTTESFASTGWIDGLV